MTKPLTVRDRHGKLVERADGRLLDGDWLDVPMMFADGAARASAATLASAATILGDGFDETELSKLTDTAARHAVVCKRLGKAADGRGAAFLDAAWGALAGSPAKAAPAAPAASQVVLTRDQVARGREGVRQAMASLGDTAAKPVQRKPVTDAELRAGQERIRGSYVAMKAEMRDAWRGGAPAPVALSAQTEAMFRSGKITDNPVNRARAELAQTLADGWKERT